jgi:hypothetical protein
MSFRRISSALRFCRRIATCKLSSFGPPVNESNRTLSGVEGPVSTGYTRVETVPPLGDPAVETGLGAPAIATTPVPAVPAVPAMVATGIPADPLKGAVAELPASEVSTFLFSVPGNDVVPAEAEEAVQARPPIGTVAGPKIDAIPPCATMLDARPPVAIVAALLCLS